MKHRTTTLSNMKYLICFFSNTKFIILGDMKQTLPKKKIFLSTNKFKKY